MPSKLDQGSARGRATTGEAKAAYLTRIREAALRQFAESGYDGTSMRDIGSLVGVHAGSLYVHIKSKEDLLYQIVGGIADSGEVALRQVEAADVGAVDKLRMLARIHLRWAIANPDAAKVFEREWMRLNGAQLAEVQDKRRQWADAVERIIQSGIDEGTFREMDVALAALAFRSVLNANYTCDGDPDVDGAALADEFVGFLFNGWVAPGNR
ncbi:TetR/AcrR family transcriptional regulator [Rhodococcus sp. SGAir0479]|uniref:TetR/AcrR family transcriptional regulator n=1 Tax=Rhodococcus sp. SGAir0479 TaxID=2567884 RepID=UPI0010CD3A6D|nr:TetR/AcrR family transcriptional regulator [Rhodococcus sp. SGAir0479]QCQ90394.1 TetR/AcrR family transcriptional regulator [Rhodococcus sp. SGAir0479]